MKKCPICEKGHGFEKIDMVFVSWFVYHGEVESLFMQCDHCGSEFATSEQTRRNKEAILRFKKEARSNKPDFSVPAPKLRYPDRHEVPPTPQMPSKRVVNEDVNWPSITEILRGIKNMVWQDKKIEIGKELIATQENRCDFEKGLTEIPNLTSGQKVALMRLFNSINDKK